MTASSSYLYYSSVRHTSCSMFSRVSRLLGATSAVFRIFTFYVSYVYHSLLIVFSYGDWRGAFAFVVCVCREAKRQRAHYQLEAAAERNEITTNAQNTQTDSHMPNTHTHTSTRTHKETNTNHYTISIVSVLGRTLRCIRIAKTALVSYASGYASLRECHSVRRSVSRSCARRI